MAESFDLDLDSLTIAEIETIEEIIDGPIDEAFAPGAKRGKVLRAIGYTVKRREDPTFTIEQAGDLSVSLSNLNGNGESDPTDASA